MSVTLLGARAVAAAAITAVVAIAGAGALTPSRHQAAPAVTPPVPATGGPPLAFSPNGGRTDPRARFIANGEGYGIFLTRRGAVLALSAGARRHVLSLDLVGASPRRLVAERRQPGKVNSFIGSDRARWVSGLPTFAAVRYERTWPGIDTRYHGRGRLLEYDFLVAPGADPARIAVRLRGAERLRIADDGSLVATVGGRALRQHPPEAWQVVAGSRRPVDVRYRLDGQVVGIEAGHYDTTRPLLIDPVLSYATYLGGTGDDEPGGVAVDSSGAIYIAGTTTSSDFPKQGAIDSTQAGDEAFVTKLNASGNQVVYSTYLGGSASDGAADVAVHSDGTAYVTGGTSTAAGASGFPVTAGARACHGTPGFVLDAWVARLNAAGSALTWSTCLNGDDVNGTVGGGSGIAVDASGSAYVTGITSGNIMASPGSSFDSSHNGNYDAFLVKLTSAGAVGYTGFLGGTTTDFGHDVAVDSTGAAYVTGETASTDFTTAGTSPLQTTKGDSYDAFVAKINASGSARTYATYLGGTGSDAGHGIAVDGSGIAYVVGQTTGTFPGLSSSGSITGFLAKIPANGSSTGYLARRISGNNTVQAYDVDVRGSNTFVTGKSFASSIGEANTVRPHSGGTADVFLRKYNSALDVVFSTFLGATTNNSQADPDVVVNADGTAYVVGTTSGDGFATSGALDASRAAYEGFLAIVAPSTASITDGPSGPTQDSTPTFGYSSDSGSTFQCKVDGAGYSTCPGTTSGSTTLAAQSPGAHTFYVRQVDGGGTAGPAASRAFTVDASAPSAPALEAPAGGAATGFIPQFTWAASSDALTGVASYEVLVDGTKVADVPGGCAPCSAVQPVELTEGPHTWRVTAIDGAGNRADSEERPFSVAVAPTAAFTIAPNPVLAGRTAAFDGRGSSDERGSIARWEWDLDGNGSFETDGGATPTTARAYTSAGDVTITLRVTDAAGLTATTSQVLRVSTGATAGTQFGVSINKGAQYTNDPDVKLKVVFPTFTTSILVSNDGGFDTPEQFLPIGEINWKLDSSGPERLPKTVYVRFLPSLTQGLTFTDDIILDETAPKVQTATLAPAAGAASAAAARKYRLRLKATDSNSGVATVQVAANKRKPGKALKYRSRLTVRAAARPKFVRARDRAGNYSAWKKLR